MNRNPPLETTASMKTLKSDDVSYVCHRDVPNECHPSKSCLEMMSNYEVVGLMGVKRGLKEKLDSPSKRFRGSSTYYLKTILGYPKEDKDKDLVMESDPAKLLSSNVELLESDKENDEGNQPQDNHG